MWGASVLAPIELYSFWLLTLLCCVSFVGHVCGLRPASILSACLHDQFSCSSISVIARPKKTQMTSVFLNNSGRVELTGIRRWTYLSVSGKCVGCSVFENIRSRRETLPIVYMYSVLLLCFHIDFGLSLLVSAGAALS